MTNFTKIYPSSSTDSKAGGILPYTIYNSKIYFMLGEENRGISDFGGFRDHDESDEEGASREFNEETLALFCPLVKERGTNNGVLITNKIFSDILRDSELQKLGMVTKIWNPKSRYNMFIAPVNRFLECEEFRILSSDNDERPYHVRINCAEKNAICWLSIEDMISLIEDNELVIKWNNKEITLFRNFRGTIDQEEVLLFIKQLASLNIEELSKKINTIWNRGVNSSQ